MVTIIFEAHGTTLDNEAHLASGHFDIELSPLGIQQAKELGIRYQKDEIDVIFCSDLQRSYRTAMFAFRGRDIPILQDSRLRECDYGDWTRKSSDKIEKEKGRHLYSPFPHGESYEQTATRIKLFLKDVLKQHDNKRILIIGHRATQYGLEHWINKIPLETTVTASWQWQPGWLYQFNNI